MLRQLEAEEGAGEGELIREVLNPKTLKS